MRPLVVLAFLAFALPVHAEPKAPTARTAVTIRSEQPPSQRVHTKWHYERAAKRCDRRATEWARNRCYREAARQ